MVALFRCSFPAVMEELHSFLLLLLLFWGFFGRVTVVTAKGKENKQTNRIRKPFINSMARCSTIEIGTLLTNVKMRYGSSTPFI